MKFCLLFLQHMEKKSHVNPRLCIEYKTIRDKYRFIPITCKTSICPTARDHYAFAIMIRLRVPIGRLHAPQYDWYIPWNNLFFRNIRTFVDKSRFS